jgi:hypothetical protein
MGLQERGNRVHAIQVLEEDHVRLERLLYELGEAGEATRTRLSERFAKELMVHTMAEDNIFLPQVEDAIEDSKRMTGEFFEGDVLTEASGLVAETYEHNRRIRDLLQGPSVASEGELDGLRKAMQRHIELEDELFPKAREVLEEEDFERIGDLIEHCKWQVRGLEQASLASSASFRPRPVETFLE